MNRRGFLLVFVGLLAGLGTSTVLFWRLPNVPEYDLPLPTSKNPPHFVKTLEPDRRALLWQEPKQPARLEVYQCGFWGLRKTATFDLGVPNNAYIHQVVLFDEEAQAFVSYVGGMKVLDLRTGKPLWEVHSTPKRGHRGSVRLPEKVVQLCTQESVTAVGPTGQRYQKPVHSRIEEIRWEPVVSRELIYESPGDASAYPISGNRLICMVSENSDQQGVLRVVDRPTRKMLKECDVGRAAMEVQPDYVVVFTLHKVADKLVRGELVIDLHTLETLPSRPARPPSPRPASAQYSATDPETGQVRYFSRRDQRYRVSWPFAHQWLRRWTGWPKQELSWDSEFLEWLPGIADPASQGTALGAEIDAEMTADGRYWSTMRVFGEHEVRLVCWNLLRPARPWRMILGGGVLSAGLVVAGGWIMCRLRTASTVEALRQPGHSPTPSTPTAAPAPSP